jgi:hypothetical protein
MVTAFFKKSQRKTSEHTQSMETEAPSAIEIVQCAMANPSGVGLAPLAAALEHIVQSEAWRRDVSGEDVFACFGEFAIAEAPRGLGVRSESAAKLLRNVLFEQCLFGPWTEVLERIARKPGRQPKFANSEGLVRFYTVHTSTTSRDRLLLKLKSNHPDIFKRVCEGTLTVHEGGIEARLVVPVNRHALRFGVCDLKAAKLLPEKA